MNWKAETRLRDLCTNYFGDDSVPSGRDAAAKLEHLGIVLKAEGFFSDAQIAFEKAIELAPDRPQYYRSLAEIQREMRLTREAVDTVQHAITLDPGNNQCRQLLAELYLDMGIFSGAVEQAEAILRQSPGHLPALVAKVIAFQELGQLEEAILIAQRIIGLTPYEPQHHYALGRLYQDKGMWREALTQFECAVNIAPGTELADMAQEEMRAVDTEQIQQIMLLAAEDPIVRMKLERNPATAVSDLGFHLSEPGIAFLSTLDLAQLPKRPVSWGPCRFH